MEKTTKNIFTAALVSAMALVCNTGISEVSRGAGIAKIPEGEIDLVKKLVATDENPLVAMLVPNGRPTKAELSEFLELLRAGGYEQFLVYARSGCETPYLSEEWFENCAYMVSRGEELGFKSVWLYDEFNWPSGTADKRVMKLNPDFALKYLAANKNGNGGVEFALRKNPQMADLLNPAAVDCFIKLTHEEYFKRLGDSFGKTVKGIFSDEPSIGYFDKSIADTVKIPWYDSLEKDYLKNTGRNLRSDVIKDFDKKNPVWQEEVSRLISKRFADSYTRRISKWCGVHGILSTGHLLAEVNTRAAARSNGWILEPLCGFSFAGMDEIDTHTNFDKIEWLTFASVMYAAEKRGNNGALAELFALGPVDMPLSKMRLQIWLAACHGVNRYVTAINQLDLRIKISDDPFHLDGFAAWLSSPTPNQPYFENFKILADDAKLAAGYAVKPRDIEIGVRYPYAIEPVEKILRALAKRQIQYVLLSESDEAAEFKFVANPVGGEVFEEKSGRKFASEEQFADWLESEYVPQTLLLEKDGSRAKNIFVRSYKDGASAVLNFEGTRRELVLCKRGGEKVPVYIEPCEVKIFPSDVLAQAPKTKVCRDFAGAQKWGVCLDRPNTLHADFKDGKFFFTLTSPMKLSFAVRDFLGAKGISLNGEKLETEKPCTALVGGFSNLYAQTKPVYLPAGRHVLETDKSAQDFAYMPLCFVTGRFSNDGLHTISEYNYDGEGLYGYAGKISQGTKLKVPADAKTLRVDTNLVAEVFVNGASLGARAWSPFEWDVSAFAGEEIFLTVVRKPSFGGLFGKKLANKEFSNKWATSVFRAFKPSNEKPIAPTAKIEFLCE